VEKTLQTRSTEIRRVHYLQKDQSILEWEIHTYLVPENAGKPQQVILLEQNITEKRKLEAELIQSEKLAAVGQLAAGIAHDINNPLTSIIANAQILIADLPVDEPDLQQCAHLIELAGTKASQVVRNLLTSARKEEFQFAPVDINESIQSALMLLSHEFISRDIIICFNRGYEMPEISASENHLQSVWTNLIMNSIEAIGDHPGRIDIGTQYDGENFIVCIRDDGKGIPNEYIGQIFEPFFTTKRTQDGTGLGLTSVRRIVQAHNGRILVESEEDKGTTFTVVLPGEQKFMG
jgi:two-component system NtrC family sensor kinase